MSALPSLGHVNPCLSVAEALANGGHEVRLATAPGLAPHVRQAGFDHVNFGFDLPRPGEVVTPRLMQRLYSWLDKTFDFWIDDLTEQAEQWSPDVLVRDWTEVAGMAVGARLGIPSAVLGNALRPPMTHIAESRCWLGVDVEEFGGVASAFGDLLLNLYPPCFAVPGEPRLGHEHFLQPARYDGAGSQRPPDWLSRLDGGPLVYITMGTYYGRLPRVMESLAEAAGGVSAQIVVTVGNARDPKELEPLPPNVRVERYVPQSFIIPHCAAVICEGGLNTMMGALSHGVPVGCLPVTWGQPLGFNDAERCEQLGAGLLYPIDPTGTNAAGEETPFGGLDPERIVRMIDTLLAEPTYRKAAGQVRAEIESLPDMRHAVELIEKLVA